MIADRRRLVASLLLVIAGATAVSTLLNAAYILRPALTLAFVCFVPGGAVVMLMRLRSPMAELALAMGLSLALCTVGATAMVWSGAWNPMMGITVLAALSMLLLVGAAVRGSGSPPAEERLR